MINIGSKQLKGISVGNRAVKEVYKGSQKIWAKESWINVSLTKYSFGTTTSNSGTTEVISSSLNINDLTKITFRLSGSFSGGELSYKDLSGTWQYINSDSTYYFNNLIVNASINENASSGSLVSISHSGSRISININTSKQITVYYWKHQKINAYLDINKIELLS